MPIMNMNKSKLISAALAGVASTITIGILAFISTLNIGTIVLAVSFGATLVLVHGFPNNPFGHPTNIFFGHFVTAFSAVLVCSILSGPLFILIATSVGIGIFLMIALDVVHPPAGGNPIAVVLSDYGYDFLLQSIVPGTLLIIFLGYIINNFILHRKYP